MVEALRVVDGWCSLRRRDATLDGSLPLRVAQGCEPMLEGAAYGLQVALHTPLRALRRWGRWKVNELPLGLRVERWGLETPGGRDGAALRRAEAQARAALPALVARGVVGAEAAAGLSLVEVVRSPTTWVVRLWTGYLVRVSPAARLVALRASPRRCVDLDLSPAALDAHLGWTPLVLDLELRRGAEEVIVEGEVATLGVLPPSVPAREVTLDEAPDLARALLAFYDPEYFEAKRRGEVTRSYRRLPKAPAGDGAPWVRVARGGPAELSVEPLEGAGVTALAHRCAVDLAVRFDGQRVRLEADDAALQRRARAIEAAWSFVASPDDPACRGALLYLTRYMTPHPFGEPHFFVKPCALVQTPPGWSTLVEGVGVEGVGDTLRGVVRTDAFHALPAVFALPTGASKARLRRGQLLARLIPTPRAWTAPTLDERAFALTGALDATR
ncbi:MAG: hypothetical protein R3A48_04185 [Polyangiales bacterium]